jgi:hypothetical protein
MFSTCYVIAITIALKMNFWMYLRNSNCGGGSITPPFPSKA